MCVPKVLLIRFGFIARTLKWAPVVQAPRAPMVRWKPSCWCSGTWPDAATILEHRIG